MKCVFLLIILFSYMFSFLKFQTLDLSKSIILNYIRVQFRLRLYDMVFIVNRLYYFRDDLQNSYDEICSLKLASVFYIPKMLIELIKK